MESKKVAIILAFCLGISANICGSDEEKGSPDGSPGPFLSVIPTPRTAPSLPSLPPEPFMLNTSTFVSHPLLIPRRPPPCMFNKSDNLVIRSNCKKCLHPPEPDLNVLVVRKRQTQFFKVDMRVLEKLRMNFILNFEKILSANDNIPLTSPYFKNCLLTHLSNGTMQHHEALKLIAKSNVFLRMHEYKKLLNGPWAWDRDKLVIRWFLLFKELSQKGVEKVNFEEFFGNKIIPQRDDQKSEEDI